jgi:hypothetical protein
MYKDSHLMDSLQQYIRTRQAPVDDREDPERFMMYYGGHALRFLTEDFNQGELGLVVIH